MTNTELRNGLYERGFANVNEYLDCLADDYGIDRNTVYTLYEMMPEELFDGLVTMVEDICV